MKLKLSWPKSKKVDNVGVALYSSVGECVYATNTTLDDYPFKASNSINYSVDLEIGAGNYFIMAGTFKGPDDTVVDFISEGPAFIVDEDNSRKGTGLTRLRHYWKEE